MKIPDYYKQFQSQPSEEKSKSEKSDQKENSPKSESKVDKKQETRASKEKSAIQDKTILYQANSFTLNQLEDWKDKTIYTLTGPVTDGIQHNVVITVDDEPAFENLIDYAEWNIKILEQELKSCMLLKKDEIKLNNGMEAFEAIFSWYPVDDIRIYQQQIYILDNSKAYKLTASFTKKTRRTLGPQVERMMLSFEPGKESEK